MCTVPKEIYFLRYNMKCSGENVILSGIVHVVSSFLLHFMLYRGNLDCFSNKVNIGAELYRKFVTKLNFIKVVTKGFNFDF